MNKLLVKAILQKAQSFNWSLQGFGMLRLYLSQEVRLHVWDSRYAVPGVSVIHTHPWDFLSQVVAGKVGNILFNESETKGMPFHKQVIQCGPGGGLCGMPTDVLLHPAYEELYIEGQSYTQNAQEIHASRPADGTVTILTRTFREDTEHAAVYWPAGTEWGSAEPRPATPEEVAAITGNALSRWFV